MTEALLAEQVRRLELLHKVGIALSAEQSKDRLVEMILLEAKSICNADGGTLYIREGEELHFSIVRSDTLGIALGGSTGAPIHFQPLPVRDPLTGEPNLRNVATAAVAMKRSFNIPDAYDAEGFDFSGTKEFDKNNGYRSRSFLTIPLVNYEGYVIAVLQLLNAKDPETGELLPFTSDQQSFVEALASQAALALDNQLLLEGQKALLESFIKMIAAAIDAKSPYTGGHCERVPILTEMLTRSVCDAQTGPFAYFNLTRDEWYELHIAAWLHDCGKVTTPVHVMDKATKLETIFDRIEIVRARFEVLRRDAELAHYKRLANGASAEASAAQLKLDLQALDDDQAFLEKANVGGEFLPHDQQERIRSIGRRPLMQNGEATTLLTDEEVRNLVVSRGTLTDEERIIINGHMVHTVRMLEALPFPRNLRRVPEYASGHHEKMDGTGYPRGIYASDMSIPARIMAIADVFEALTATDRPYKKGKKLSETMRIMGFMKRDNHLDPELFDHFVRSKVYRAYAERYLSADLLDEVDEEALLAIEPKPYVTPPSEERQRRWKGFLPQYQPLVRDSARFAAITHKP